MMKPIVLFLLLALKFNSSISMTEEKLKSLIQLQDYEVNDLYDDVQKATRKALFGHGFTSKNEVEIERAERMRDFHITYMPFEDMVEFEIFRNWTLLTKTGDYLLPSDKFKMLVEFHNKNLNLTIMGNVICLNETETVCKLTHQEYVDLLRSDRNISHLNRTWNEWQENYDKEKDKFAENLQLVNLVLTENQAHLPRDYWESMSEYENGYLEAEILWKDVQPLYNKLHSFVKTRIQNFYNISDTDSIPVYLLGDNFGTDWSNVADIVLPHPYLYDEVQTELKYWTVENIYQLGQTVTKTIGLGSLSHKFWIRSLFNKTFCGPHIISNSAREFSEVITCRKLGWKEFLDIHETTMNIALRNQDYSSLGRQEIHFSAADEALSNLGSILAIENLEFYNFVPKNGMKEDDKFNRKNTALLLTALRVLPKLAYYYLADQWRLRELEFSYGNLTETWWEMRDDIQGVSCDYDLKKDYLGDSHITSNKPYLSKFLGIFLEFQIVDYYRKFFLTENGTLMDFIAKDTINFKDFVQDRPRKAWLNMMSYHLGISKISSEELLNYFRPLEDYLDSAPLHQVKLSTTPKVRTTTTPLPKATKAMETKTNVTKNETSSNDTKGDTKSAKANNTKEDVNSSGISPVLITVLVILAVLIAALILFVALNRFENTRDFIHRHFNL